MKGKQKSYHESPDDHLHGKARNEAQKTGQNPESPSLTEPADIGFNDPLRNELLGSYAIALPSITYDRLGSFIVSESVRIFNLQGAVFAIYDPVSLRLKTGYVSGEISRYQPFSQLPGPDNTSINIPVSAELYHRLCNEPLIAFDGLHASTFGAINETTGREVESALNLGWFFGINLTSNKSLKGTLIFTGSAGEVQPGKNLLNLFGCITSNAVALMLADGAHQECEARFATLIDESPIGYQSLKTDGTILAVNQAWLDMLGYGHGEITGRHISEFLSEKSRPEFLEGFNHLIVNSTFVQELELVSKDGNIHIFDVTGKVGHNETGGPGIIHCILSDITSQRTSGELYREREEIFEAITSYTTNWESWFDNSGKIIWTNPVAYSFTGYTPAEIIALSDYVSTLVAEEDRERITQELTEALQGKDKSSVEFTCIRKDNSRFRISVSWNHISDRQGKPLGIRASGQDITSYRKAEEAVTFTEGLYKQMVENAPFGMHFYQVNEQGKLVFTGANTAANRILGIEHSHLHGLTIEQAFPSLTGTDVIGHYLDAAIDNKTWVTDQIEYADNLISGAFEVKAFQTVPGRMVAIFSDITKRKQAEKDLEESQQLFEALARVSPVGIFRTNSKGETTYVNPRWALLTGLSFEDAVESRFLTALHPEDRDERIEEWREAVEKGKAVVSEYRLLRPDGSVIWVQGNAVPEIADGKIKGFIGTITDITDLKMAEAEMLKAKQKAEASNRFKSTFMGNISHEIRTPLNGIIGFADLISSGNNSEEENAECIEFLNHSINRLTRIIDNIMDVSMMMSGNTSIKPETFSLEELVLEVYHYFEAQATRKNLALTIEKGKKGEIPPIKSDKTLLHRILNELVDNAIKFTKSGSIAISYDLDNNYLLLSVSDTGAGISDEMLPFIFEPFIQEDVYSARVNNSNGLGLAIVYEAIGILGGTIRADSTPGKGTRISMTIPVILPEQETGSVKSAADDEIRRSPVILIVEDEEINMIYLKRLLSQEGFTTLLATNANDAFEFLGQNSDIDLILMDMKMPGMDGFEATRKIKSLYPGIRIAAVTAYAGDTDRDSCFAAGCDDYIAKPFQKNELNLLLKRMIR